MSPMQSRYLSIVLSFPVFLLMWGLYGWNTWNGDREGYELYYNTRVTLASWGKEIGYGYLNILANRSGVSFGLFQIVLSLVTLLCLYRYVLKKSVAPVASLLAYFVCFFALDFVLMRNFLAFAICLQAILCLCEGGWRGRLAYAMLILLATSVHQSSLIYMVFVVMPLGRALPLTRFLLFYCTCIGFYLLIRYFVPLPDAVAAHFSYYTTSLKSSIFNSVVHLFSVLFLALVVVGERRSILRCSGADERGKELIFVYNMNLLSLLFIPLYFESEIFIRLFRFVLFFNVLHCVNALFVWRKTHFLIVGYLSFLMLYLVIFFLVPVAEYSVIPLFKNNALLGLG
ncbi:EpsG family protein [Pseudomonas shirazica]|uniref:EpsG family protein n=1 Tax=Pseudomonas TaxID=286 RepID=UPI002553F998|nr:EpsG family protein [Pseudomonas sp. M2(2023)]MDY4312231.1 EpsG family protein [Pseudomonas putida]MDY4322128.1 EpsG family protein [Pseudomonas putida]MDY4355093.1 EpsG family protein [Pseudomonas putida]WIV25296.1 EpsG family protein [Pseudomonas sp. M2(2023)]